MESKPSTSQHLQQKVFICEELATLISSAGKMKFATTLDEVYDLLKDYICTKKLYDPYMPDRICCENDDLGSILGVNEFRIGEVRGFLQKLVYPVKKVSATTSPGDFTSVSVFGNTSKRKLEESDVERAKRFCECAPSKQPSSPMVLYIPSTPKYENTSDSHESIHGYETAFCKDTSDTNDEDVWYVRQSSDHDLHAGDIVAVEEIFDVEYEVESDDSSLCSDQGENDSYSDEEKYVEETLKTVITYICRTDSDIEFWADDSSSENECFDVEISESDQWKCNTCGQLNKPPLRYCLKCWDERKGWLREKDKQRPPQRKRSKEKAKDSAKKKVILTEDCSVWNSDCDSPSTSANTKDSSEYDSLSTKDSHSSGSSQEKFDDQIPLEKSNDLCLLCCSKPANASIIHGNIGHVICCYKCALKLKRRNKRCPVCRRTIDKVVYQVCSV